VFRLGFTYWMLFCLYVFHTEVGSFRWFDKLLGPAWDALEIWVGAAVFGVSGFPTAENGSGDKTADWIALACIATIALVAALIWALLDRRRTRDAQLRELARVVVRYTMVFVLFYFGLAKLLLLQFPALGGAQVIRRFGDASPMGLVWSFMSYSPAYVFFAGAAETLGAVLMVFRRTTTLGALVAGVVLINVTLLNYCYDVPLKLSSSHYVAMCGYLLLPDLRGFVSLLWSRRPIQPAPLYEPALRARWQRLARWTIKAAIITYLGVSTTAEELSWRPPAVTGWYEGVWMVTSFSRGGTELPALVGDAQRWSRLRFQTTSERVLVRWRLMDDSYGRLCTVAFDEAHRTVRFVPEPEATEASPEQPVTFAYLHPDADHLEIEGVVDGVTLGVQLVRFDAAQTPLLRRGYHWINEFPFHR